MSAAGARQARRCAGHGAANAFDFEHSFDELARGEIGDFFREQLREAPFYFVHVGDFGFAEAEKLAGVGADDGQELLFLNAGRFAHENHEFLPFADSPGQTRETLAFRERNLSAYAGQLLGENFSLGARYRVSEATLKPLFPDIPTTAVNFDTFQQRRHATLQELSLTANFHHRCGAFAQWESAWSRQGNAGDPTVSASEDFWQHNFVAGYRFRRRSAEIRLGLLNIFDADYRLNPLNVHAEPPRGRTLTVSLRLNF